MKLKKLSLSVRIFIAMILVVILASILVAVVAIYQYNEETKDYHTQRLDRKESAIKRHISFVIKETTFEEKTEKIPFIFKDEIYKIADVHNLQINLYDLEGGLLISSKAEFTPQASQKCLEAQVLNALRNTTAHRYVEKRLENNQTIQSSYSYITDTQSKPLAIINLPIKENDEFLGKELDEFLKLIGIACFIILLFAAIIALLLSKYITKSLKTISDKINQTRLEKRNQKIEINNASEEITTLVNSYNSMIDELEESAVKLATSEREHAWREMAKQVAHEIKNPLTPMRLSVQSFQRKFDVNDSNIETKVNEFSKTLIQQIDTMSSIASAFSNFAKMPAQQKEQLNVVEVVKLALDIFNENYIRFNYNQKEVIANFDRTQLIRVITNLVKNGIQAIPEDAKHPVINVEVKTINNTIEISVFDNGIGILEKNKPKVFEPKFTTKTSGMGLGLAMVKNIVETYKGNISFTSNLNKGTTFTVKLPRQ